MKFYFKRKPAVTRDLKNLICVSLFCQIFKITREGDPTTILIFKTRIIFQVGDGSLNGVTSQFSFLNLPLHLSLTL